MDISIDDHDMPVDILGADEAEGGEDVLTEDDDLDEEEEFAGDDEDLDPPEGFEGYEE